ncbi:MAG TPA: FecR domain-containing protein [Puia sp.]|nr:FecR domain-containing protein [Puia sp.]
MPDSSRLLELFDRYLQRRCAPEEVAELIVLLEQADAAEALTEPMLRVWADLKASKAEYPVDWGRMYARISQVEDDLFILHRRKSGGWWRVAAAASVVIVVAGVVLWGMRREEGGRPTIAVPVVAAAVRDSGTTAQSTMSTAEKRVIHLPDGSMVLLNKNSRLDYPRVFGDTSREVVLSGEAYFNITHLAGRPFVVHTGKLSTRVLGTTFNIRAYPEDKAISITVTSGRVQVMNERASVGMLVADEQIRYDVASETVVQQKVDVRPLVAWRPSEVSFDDITMEEAARRIGDSFGVTVHFVNPALKDCRVTASFYREDQLQEILTVLCAVNQMSYTIRDKDVAIDGRGCN